MIYRPLLETWSATESKSPLDLTVIHLISKPNPPPPATPARVKKNLCDKGHSLQFMTDLPETGERYFLQELRTVFRCMKCMETYPLDGPGNGVWCCAESCIYDICIKCHIKAQLGKVKGIKNIDNF